MIHWEPLTNTGSTLQSPLSSFAMRGTFSLCRAQDVCTSDPHYRTKPRYSEYIRPGSFDSLYVHSEDRLLTTMNFQQRWMTLGLATFSLHFQVDMVLELGFTNQTKMVQQARKVEKKKKKGGGIAYSPQRSYVRIRSFLHTWKQRIQPIMRINHIYPIPNSQ